MCESVSLLLPAEMLQEKRLLFSIFLVLSSPPRVVGIDDRSWKRGLRYATLLCDLERGIPIDLLPDEQEKRSQSGSRSIPVLK